MADRQASGAAQAAAAREDSRERLVAAGSNWVSAEPSQEQPGERRRPEWRLRVPEMSGGAALPAVSLPLAPVALQVSLAQPEQPEAAQRVWLLQAAERRAWRQRAERARVSRESAQAPPASLRRERGQRAPVWR